MVVGVKSAASERGKSPLATLVKETKRGDVK
jgi:hypothetical protein